jgi:hypothetical protein
MLWVPWGVEVQQRERCLTHGDVRFQKRVTVGKSLGGPRAAPHVCYVLRVGGNGGEQVEIGGVKREVAVGIVPWLLQRQGEALGVSCDLLYDGFCGEFLLCAIQ